MEKTRIASKISKLTAGLLLFAALLPVIASANIVEQTPTYHSKVSYSPATGSVTGTVYLDQPTASFSLNAGSLLPVVTEPFSSIYTGVAGTVYAFNINSTVASGLNPISLSVFDNVYSSLGVSTTVNSSVYFENVKGTHFWGFIGLNGYPKSSTTISVLDLSGNVLYSGNYNASAIGQTSVGHYVVNDATDPTTGQTYDDRIHYNFDLPNGSYKIKVTNGNRMLLLDAVSTMSSGTVTFSYGAFIEQRLNDRFFNTEFIYYRNNLRGQVLGYTLQPGDSIAAFMPSRNGIQNLYVHFPFDRTNSNNATLADPRYVTVLNASNIAASDFQLVNTSDNSVVPITGVKVNPYPSFVGEMMFTLGSDLQIGQKYELKMSVTSGGNEITLPTTKSSYYEAYVETFPQAYNNGPFDDIDAGHSTNIILNQSQPPARPTGLGYTLGDTSVVLQWNKNAETNVSGYNIYQNNVKIATVTGSTYYQVSNLPNGNYDYTVTALDTAGNESAQSLGVAAYFPHFQGTPTLNLTNKFAGTALQAGDSIVSFMPSNVSNVNELYIYLPNDNQGSIFNSTKIPSSITASDFQLVKVSDGSIVPIINLLLNPYGNYGGSVNLYLGGSLQSGSQYVLKISGTGGGKIIMPSATSNARAFVATRDIWEKNIDSYYFYQLAFANAPSGSSSSSSDSGGSTGPAAPVSPASPASPATSSDGNSTPGGSTASVSLNLDKDAIVTKEKTPDNRSAVKVVVDNDKLANAFHNLTAEVHIVSIEVKGSDPVVKVDLPTSALIDAAAKQAGAVVQIKVEGAVYYLPVNVLKDLPKDGYVTIVITKVEGQPKDEVNAAARQLGAQTLLSNPIDFTVNVNDKAITDFGGAYVDRIVSLGTAADPNKVTAVWVDDNNKLHFVPSFFTNSAGKSEITIRSPHNSLYTVIQSDNTFADLQGHWAKVDVELLANKLIVNGVEAGKFAPDNRITRAEFAALLVRSLGLVEVKAGGFKDIDGSEWFAGAVGAAKKAGLIDGFEDGTFKPQANITREQMATMIVRALKAGGKQVKADAAVLDKFADRAKVSDWSKDAVAQSLTAGIVQGMTDTTFVPQDNATRAQAASMLKRMLQYLQFIN